MHAAPTPDLTDMLPARRWRVTPAVELLVLVFAVVTVLASWRIIAGGKSGVTLLSPAVAASLLMANLLWAVLIVALLGRRIALRRTSRTAFKGGGRLHVRLVATFSLMASVPIILAVVAASILFQSGIQFWGSERARGAFNATIALAKQGQDLVIQRWTGEARFMAGDIRKFYPEIPRDSAEFEKFLLLQTQYRNLYQALLFQVVDRQAIKPLYAYEAPSPQEFQQRVTGEVLKLTGTSTYTNYDAKMLWVVTPVDRSRNLFLYVATPNNVEFLNNQSKAAVQQLAAYDSLQARARTLQLRFNLALFGVALLIVGLATWIALKVADWLANPVGELVTAADRVAGGDLSSRVATPRSSDEIAMLAHAFNRMTVRLGEQTNALVEANAAAENRRALIEAVMAGVSAGVVATSEDGVVRIANRSATDLIGAEGDRLVGQPLHGIAPELADLVASGQREAIVQVVRGGETRTLAVRIARTDAGPILTFDDITQQLLDQRRAAWSDVARRIAHEIKNPLTPIQLAAERLQRRYGGKIPAEDGTFARLTDTIIRQVADLRRMVDEFSSFARMPKPAIAQNDLSEITRQNLFMMRVAHPDMDFTFAEAGEDKVFAAFDIRLLSQAITNILKNAVEAVQAVPETDLGKGRVDVRLVLEEGFAVIEVTDNGKGFPAEGRQRLLEPYMTTREGGTGLGLAIVSKVLEEHGGGIELNDNPEGRGGRVRMRVPQVPPEKAPPGHTTPEGKPSAQDEKGAARTAPPIAEMQS